jgi:putative hydrolase of the HAD superfamily
MAKNQPIRALFLDVGGVFLTNGWDRHSRALACETFKLDPEETDSRHRLTFDIYEQGKISLDDYLNCVVFYKKRNFSKKQFVKFMYAQSKPFPEMISLLTGLKKKYDLKTVVVSNEGRELTEYRIKKFKLSSFIDFFISSCFVRLRKPDADIFHLALDVSQIPANQIVYIDDREMFVDVAESFKMHGIRHKDYQTTRTKLASFGLIFP